MKQLREMWEWFCSNTKIDEKLKKRQEKAQVKLDK